MGIFEMIKKIFSIAALTLLFCCPVMAQEVCDDTAKDALELCISEKEAECKAQFPQCDLPVIDVDTVRGLINESCGCETIVGAEETTCECDESVRNYGKYRSCVVKLLNGLRTANVIEKEVRQQILKENKICRATIKQNKKNKKKPKKDKGNNSGGDE